MQDGLKAELEKAVAGTATIEYARGYDLDATDDTSHIAAAAALAARADAAVLHVGLPHREEAEEYDRAHIDLPVSHVRLIEAVGAACARTVVVLTNGAAVAMPWLDRVPAVLETWLAGQAGAGAIAAALLGRVNPSGKLPETFPKRLEDHPAFLDFPGPDRCLRYSEGVFAGYRWFDKRRAEPLFPFGHGLSYTAFEYSGLELSAAEMGDDDTLTVSCLIRCVAWAPGGGGDVLQARDLSAFLDTSGCLWIPLDTSGYLWIPLDTSGYLKFSPFSYRLLGHQRFYSRPRREMDDL